MRKSNKIPHAASTQSFARGGSISIYDMVRVNIYNMARINEFVLMEWNMSYVWNGFRYSIHYCGSRNWRTNIEFTRKR